MSQKAIDEQYDVIIVGGGVIGLSSALSLAKLRLSVCLIEGRTYQPLNLDKIDARVFALNHASINVFKHLDVWSQMKQLRVSPYTQMKVWDINADGKIHFDAHQKLLDNLGYIVEAGVMSDILLKEAQASSYIHIKQHQTIKDIHANEGMVYLEDKTLNAHFIIGADGANSMVRNQAGILVNEKSYAQKAIVATLKTQMPHQQTAYQCFHSTGPVALLPLQDSHQVSLVWSADTIKADALLALTEQEFIAELQQHCEHILGDMTLLGQRFAFELKKQLAKRYWQGKCILVGDAAHVIHPLAGLGMNLGLMDVASLYDTLKAWQQSGKVLKASLLNRYQRERRAHAQALILGMDTFYFSFKTRNINLVSLRNWGLNQVNAKLKLKNMFMDVALGQGPFNIPYLGRVLDDGRTYQRDNTTNTIS